MNNWQRKSDHLLREIVKFQTYVDSLVAAQKEREAVYARREEKEKEKEAATKKAREADGEVTGTAELA